MLKSNQLGRAVLILVALSLLLAGILPLLKGDLFYSNYWDGPVFGPFAIMIGVFSLYLAVFRWRKLSQRPERLRGRRRRRPRFRSR